MDAMNMPIVILNDPIQVIAASAFCQHLCEPVLVIYGRERTILTPTASDENTATPFSDLRDLSDVFPFDFLIRCSDEPSDDAPPSSLRALQA